MEAQSPSVIGNSVRNYAPALIATEADIEAIASKVGRVLNGLR